MSTTTDATFTQAKHPRGLKSRYHLIELPDMVGKPMKEVYEYLKATYGEDRLAEVPGDLNEFPKNITVWGWHHFFGSVFRDRGGRATVPCVRRCGEEFRHNVFWLSNEWVADARAVLLND